MPIRTLLVDDEGPARAELAYLLESFPDIEIQESQTAKGALEAIRNEDFDLVFLDIQMPGMDGFEVLQHARLLPDPPLFVFVTAYDQYAIRAFEQNTVDYLLKPISTERLKVSVERVRELLGKKTPDIDPQPELADLLAAKPGNTALQRLTVEHAGSLQLINFEEITYFELSDRKIVANTHDSSHPCHGLASLDDVEEKVGSLPFLRINRSTVVNLNHIQRFSPWVGGKYCLTLDDDGSTELTLSRGRVKEFKLRLGL